MQSKIPISFVVMLLCFTVFAFAFAGLAYRGRFGLHAAHERLGIEQFHDRIAAVHLLLAPSHAAIQQIVEPGTIGDPDGGRYPVWSVEWVDDGGDELVHTVWNARTGELVQVQRTIQHRNVESRPSTDSRAAVQEGWRWMSRLGVAHYAKRWRLEAAPHSGRFEWIVIWDAPGYVATAMMDRQTYQLDQLVVEKRSIRP